eukprot:c25441_g1_i1.p1 GENE.c25441_g1_i1~~c25441_g1_i1.p1  ORF type:complete len:613 (+),score=83.73 c25441_g1_i1:48-1886(+)
MNFGFLIALATVCLAEPERVAGPITVFGKLGTKNDGIRIGQTEKAEILDSRGFRAVGAGSLALGLITTDGVAYKLDDATSAGELLIPIRNEEDWCWICKGVVHTVAVTCQGRAYTWGGRSVLTSPDDRVVPGVRAIPLWDKSKIIQVSCGANHTMLLTETREVLTFGLSSFGRLGLYTTEVISSVQEPAIVEDVRPQNMLGDDTVCFVEAGPGSSFAVTERGDMYVWGMNDKAQLGLGYASEAVRTPTLVATPFRACEVAAGDGFVLAYDVNGEVWGWGGETLSPTLHGTEAARAFYESLKPYERPIMLAAGDHHAVLLLANGSVYATGSNEFGQVGQNSGSDFVEPQRIEYLDSLNVGAVYASNDYTVIHSHVKHPMNCRCARGGRRPTKFGIPGAVPIVTPPLKAQVTQPESVPSENFSPVTPKDLRSRIGGQALPGEVEHAPVRSMHDPLDIHRIESLANNKPTKNEELAPAVARTLYYPEGSNEALAWSSQGMAKGKEQVIFGKHVAGSGYFYGDDSDAEVMPNTGNFRAMPDYSSALTPTLASSQNLDKVFSLSLQDVKRPKGPGDEKMRGAEAVTVRELQDYYRPPSFHGDEDWGFGGKAPSARVQ